VAARRLQPQPDLAAPGRPQRPEHAGQPAVALDVDGVLVAAAAEATSATVPVRCCSPPPAEHSDRPVGRIISSALPPPGTDAVAGTRSGPVQDGPAGSMSTRPGTEAGLVATVSSPDRPVKRATNRLAGRV
jgi:hypothetical protein